MITELDKFSADMIGKEDAFMNCDCMDLMAKLPDKSIDLAIVDPPYGDGGGAMVRSRAVRATV